MQTNQFCYCDCHKMWGSVVPPKCTCNCRANFVGFSNQIEPLSKSTEKGLLNEHMVYVCQRAIEDLIEKYNHISCKIDSFQDYVCKKENNKFVDKNDNIFEFKPVDAKGKDDIRHVKNALYDFYSWILDNAPENRERSLAITRIEECAMWLNKSISRRK